MVFSFLFWPLVGSSAGLAAFNFTTCGIRGTLKMQSLKFLEKTLMFLGSENLTAHIGILVMKNDLSNSRISRFTGGLYGNTPDILHELVNLLSLWNTGNAIFMHRKSITNPIPNNINNSSFPLERESLFFFLHFFSSSQYRIER
ncbi:Trm5p [Saccharomyces cerevisiae x Saccharomyces kudriavzevii VIN7]|uniref:Trm5p n=1 Tax=Saccharomyces cerevisiae x Saccharomyces kudriavzevii (strain VIN7) TaxID=1095631 RepID=H0GVS2_SACCK|nr:Trm5p [Saccharomyces cerevisiae x Saccharomyces kudriavzevii VIN7]